MDSLKFAGSRGSARTPLGGAKARHPRPPSLRVSDASRPRMIRVPSTFEHVGKIRTLTPLSKNPGYGPEQFTF